MKEFMREIVKQFSEQTGLKLPQKYSLYYDPLSNSIKSKKTLDSFLD